MKITQAAIQNIPRNASSFPDRLRAIPQPPSSLHLMSSNWDELIGRPHVAIVGSRKVTAYGRAVTMQLASDLAKGGVVVVSGLALGIDGIAHGAALEAGGLTVAVLAGGLGKIYPSSHHNLAQRIVAQGGALISEYPSGTPSLKHHFVERNRIVSGLSHAVLITEAAERSGTLHTASFALEQGRDVLAVPGNITSPQSAGTNRLLKSGAIPITCAEDVFRALGLQTRPTIRSVLGDTPAEQSILNVLATGESDGDTLLQKSGLEVQVFNQTLTMLEIRGNILSIGGNKWTLA